MELDFTVTGAQAVPFAASPTLALKLRVTSRDPNATIHSVILRCQIQIEANRRRYEASEQERLIDLFGTPERWGQTLRPMLWANVQTVVPPFSGSTVADMQLPCTFDFNIAAAKYFAGLENGEVPLCLLFSGTVFYESHDGSLQVNQISWDRESKYRLPVIVWQQMMEGYYPNLVWLCLRRDVFDRLHAFKLKNGIPTWEQAVDQLLRNDTVESPVVTLSPNLPTRVAS